MWFEYVYSNYTVMYQTGDDFFYLYRDIINYQRHFLFFFGFVFSFLRTHTHLNDARRLATYKIIVMDELKIAKKTFFFRIILERRR